MENVFYLPAEEEVVQKTKVENPYCFIIALDKKNDSREETFSNGFQFIRANKANLYYNTEHRMLIYPEKRYDILSKENSKEELAKIVHKRSKTRFPRSIRQHSSIEMSVEVEKQFANAGASLYQLSLLPEVECGTYGNMSIMCEDDSFIITGRNVDKGKLTKELLCHIEEIKPYNNKENERIYCEVIYDGVVKPSIDSAIHGAIYKNSHFKAVIHVHTEKIYDRYPITHFNYPCGSEREKDDIIKSLASAKDGIIQLKKHGLIIMGETLEDCYQKLITTMQETSIRPYDEQSDEGVFQVWYQHLCEVHPHHDESFLNKDQYYVIDVNGQSFGTVYLRMDAKKLTFSLYITPDSQKRNYGIGTTIVSILEGIARSYKLNELELLTVDDCNVTRYYERKHGFSLERRETDGLIHMKKTVTMEE
jgi:ribulose-5-phosphate 4-epimerase/fuculose-1-phosphate aldolase